MKLNDVLIVLYCTIGVLVVAIIYKKLIKRMSRNTVASQDYCILYGLEESPSTGEVELYFTTETKRRVKMNIVDKNFQLLQTVFDDEVKPGGQIVKFDTAVLSNGEYFYQLESENQKTSKKMIIRHSL